MMAIISMNRWRLKRVFFISPTKNMVVLALSPQAILLLPHLSHKVKTILLLSDLALSPGERHLVVITEIRRVVV